MISKKRVAKSNENVQHEHNTRKTKFLFSFSYKNDSTNVSFSVDAENIKFLEERIVDDIVHEALTINIPTGTAKILAEKVAKTVTKKFNTAKQYKKEDIDTYIAEEMEKYHDNLAYVYKNRGKII